MSKTLTGKFAVNQTTKFRVLHPSIHPLIDDVNNIQMDFFRNWFGGLLFFLSSLVLADTYVTTQKTTSVTSGQPNPNCPQFQAFGYPSTNNPKILRRGFYTCRIGYAALYDPAEKTPLWVAQRLTKSSFAANAERGQLDFIPDPDIPYGAMPFDSDYEGSGYDKGHMAPAGDFKSSHSSHIASS